MMRKCRLAVGHVEISVFNHGAAILCCLLEKFSDILWKIDCTISVDWFYATVFENCSNQPYPKASVLFFANNSTLSILCSVLVTI